MRDTDALELSWCEVYSIVTEEVETILGVRIQCRINVVDSVYTS